MWLAGADGERTLLLLVTLRAAVEDPFSFVRHLSLLDAEEEELR